MAPGLGLLMCSYNLVGLVEYAVSDFACPTLSIRLPYA
jgi:hypothetical protein